MSLEHRQCGPHPGSLLGGALDSVRANHGWLLYHSCVRTTRAFLHDATVVGSIPLLLFGGQLALHRLHGGKKVTPP